MNISELSIRRPVLATVMNVILVVFGVVGFRYLAVRDYPAIDPPLITVTTTYAGANADVMESQVTEPLEKELNGIPGIRTITSTSSVGRSTIRVEFDLSADLEAAANDVRDKVSQATRRLPRDLDAPPAVAKADADGEFILILAVRSSQLSLMELSEYAENVLQPQLQTIDQVASVGLLGQKQPAMRLWVRPERLAAYGLSFADLQRALAAENVELPSGKLAGDQTELTLRTMGRLETERDFANVLLRQDARGTVRVSDVARVELSPRDQEREWRYDGSLAVGLSVVPQPGANYVEIADEFNRRIEQIRLSGDSRVELTVLLDLTRNVRASIEEVYETLAIAFALVVLVVFVFFRSWLTALRPLVDIPISLIATFFVMYLAGFSINILTLLGIVLATGLVVDDGIVVTENIYRKIEEGMPLRRAAIEGSREIFFAVVSTSVTLAVVFLPIIFLEGFTGQLFKEFGVVVGASVLISSFVSLTITPVLNIYLNKPGGGQGWFYRVTEPYFEGMERGYGWLLWGVLRHRWVAWVIVVGTAVMMVVLYRQLPSELAPIEDRSNIRFTLTAPEGTGYERMRQIAGEFTTYLEDSVPERDFVFSATPGFSGTGSNSAFGRVGLVGPDERERTQQQIANKIQAEAGRFNDARIFAVQEQTIAVGLGSRGALPVQFVLQHLDFEQLRRVLPEFLDRARQDPTFRVVDSDLKFNKPEVRVSLNRERLRDLGLSTQDVALTLQAAYSGGRLAYFIREGRQYEVIAQVERASRQSPGDLSQIYLTGAAGQLVPLIDVVTIEETSQPPNLYHFNRYRSATVSAALAPGYTIGDGVEAMERIAAELLDETFSTALAGPSRDYRESSSNTMFAFLLALALIYLILAAQFESFIDPFTIMITVPLALAGAVLSLWLTGQTLNIFSQIGAIMLIGLVTKNGILIVEFAHQIRRRPGSPGKLEAVREAAMLRLRPILMTTLTMVLGAMPLALSLGSAATSRRPLGVVIVGGLLFSLLLTLIVIPAIYTYLSPSKKPRDPNAPEAIGESAPDAPDTHDTNSALALPPAPGEGRVPAGPSPALHAIGHLIMLAGGVLAALALGAPAARAQAQPAGEGLAPRPLSLAQVQALALERNLALRIEQGNLAAARQLNTLGVAGALPALEADLTNQTQRSTVDQELATGLRVNRTGVAVNNTQASLISGLTLYNGQAVRQTRRRLAALESQSQQALNAQVQSTLARATLLYFDIVRQQSFISTLSSSIEGIRARKRIIDARRAVGLANAADAYQVQIDLNLALQDSMGQQVILRQAMADLAIELALPPRQRIDIEDTLLPDTTLTLEPLLGYISANPGLLAAEQTMAVARADERIAGSALLPLVRAQVGFNFFRQQATQGVFLRNIQYGPFIGGIASVPIYQGGALRAQERAAAIRTGNATLERDQLTLAVEGQLVVAYERYGQALSQRPSARQSYLMAGQLLSLTLERLRLGQATILDVRVAQQTYEQAGFVLVDVAFQALSGQIELLRLTNQLRAGG